MWTDPDSCFPLHLKRIQNTSPFSSETACGWECGLSTRDGFLEYLPSSDPSVGCGSSEVYELQEVR
jgi:hypothetical protein